MRQSRKLDHLKYALLLKDGPVVTGFDDISLIHNCLPDISWADIDVSTSVAGISLPHPVILNAITGGGADVQPFNAQLAEFARLSGSVMAVGSQFAALENPEVWHSYTIVNQVNPDGIVFANLGAHATSEQAKRAIDMIGARAIQIHLNVAQEMFMPEGDRNFSGYLDNIARIVREVDVPVIVKEVGCGIAKEQAYQIAMTGVKAIDVGGAGGTNFLAIEAARSCTQLTPETLHWGIPTAISAIEVSSCLTPQNTDLIVSGGIRTPLEIVKSLSLGAAAVGMANPILRSLHSLGMEGTLEWFQLLLTDIKRFMLLMGATSIAQLSTVPLVISGKTKEWLTSRNIDLTKYASRGWHG
ncbi:MAG: type 2 isopentenyl-diphosphate Delta-isomerase [Veillonellales bacterium]